MLSKLIAVAAFTLPLMACAGTPESAQPKNPIVELLRKYDDARDAVDSAALYKEIAQKLGEVSDDDLEGLYRKSMELEQHHMFNVAPDVCLTEMIRRGGGRWEKFIQNLIDKRNGAWGNAGGHGNDVWLLTALRRAQRKDDPLPILVQGQALVSFKIGFPPTINTNLTNLDPEKAILTFTTGGDYRGASRHNRYRLQITDAEGHILPEREDYDRGGFLGSETLHSRESYPMQLNIGSYVQIDKPGTYMMVVQYHPDISIAYLPRVDGLICCQSIPIKLIVEPIDVETTEREQVEIAKLIGQLPDKGTVHILGGAYNPEAAGEFLPKGSPAAELQIARWKAVPALIAAVNADKINPTQRAWALGLLYAITSLNNPMKSPDVLGPYEYRYSNWVSTGNSGGMGSYGESGESSPSGSIELKVQMEFAKRWKPWLDNGYIQVKKVPEKKEKTSSPL